MKYSDRLRELRTKRNLSQQQLADILKINRSTYARYELGETQPDLDLLAKIADFYEVTTDYIIRGKKKDSNTLPELTSKDERDIAKKLETILDSMSSDTALAFDGEPMDDETKELVKEAIESNLRLTKKLAKAKFTPKKYRKNNEE